MSDTIPDEEFRAAMSAVHAGEIRLAAIEAKLDFLISDRRRHVVTWPSLIGVASVLSGAAAGLLELFKPH